MDIQTKYLAAAMPEMRPLHAWPEGKDFRDSKYWFHLKPFSSASFA